MATKRRNFHMTKTGGIHILVTVRQGKARGRILKLTCHAACSAEVSAWSFTSLPRIPLYHLLNVKHCTIRTLFVINSFYLLALSAAFFTLYS